MILICFIIIITCFGLSFTTSTLSLMTPEDSGLLSMRSDTLVGVKTGVDGYCRKYHFYSAIL